MGDCISFNIRLLSVESCNTSALPYIIFLEIKTNTELTILLATILSIELLKSQAYRMLPYSRFFHSSCSWNQISALDRFRLFRSHLRVSHWFSSSSQALWDPEWVPYELRWMIDGEDRFDESSKTKYTNETIQSTVDSHFHRRSVRCQYAERWTTPA